MSTRSGRRLPAAPSPGAVVLVGLALAAPPLSAAQEAPIVSSEVAVSANAASLQLELRGADDLEIVFRDGTVRVDGTDVGPYARGEALESAWRGLLSEAVRLDPDELTRVLREWSPPDRLAGADSRTAESVALALRERLAEAPSPADEAPERPQVPLLETQADDVLRALLLRPNRLRQLTELLEELEIGTLTIRVGEDVSVGPDDGIDGTLVVVDGDLEVEGRIEEHAVVLGGTANLREGGRIGGDLRWRNGQVLGDRDIVEGAVVEVEDLRSRLESEIRDEIRRALPEAVPPPPRARNDRPWFEGFRPFRNVVGGIVGLIQTAVTYLVLLLLGALAFAFFRRNLEVVAETARKEPGRSALVGIAGFVLVFPVWILGIIGLAISLIGIPLLLGWIPLFPLAVGAACLLGFIALALVTGEWVAAQRFQGLDWVEETRPLHRVALGLGVLLVAFAAANVVQMAGPWLGFLRGLLLFAGIAAVVGAVTIGFGAVLLSRAGRTRPYAVPGAGTGAGEAPAGGGPMDEGVREWEREFRRGARGPDPSTRSEPEAGGTATATAEVEEEEAAAEGGEEEEPGQEGPSAGSGGEQAREEGPEDDDERRP